VSQAIHTCMTGLHTGFTSKDLILNGSKHALGLNRCDCKPCVANVRGIFAIVAITLACLASKTSCRALMAICRTSCSAQKVAAKLPVALEIRQTSCLRLLNAWLLCLAVLAAALQQLACAEQTLRV